MSARHSAALSWNVFAGSPNVTSTGMSGAFTGTLPVNRLISVTGPDVAADPSGLELTTTDVLRVADFSWVGVGPISTQVLAMLGAAERRAIETDKPADRS